MKKPWKFPCFFPEPCARRCRPCWAAFQVPWATSRLWRQIWRPCRSQLSVPGFLQVLMKLRWVGFLTKSIGWSNGYGSKLSTPKMDGFPAKHDHFCGSFGTIILNHSQISAEIGVVLIIGIMFILFASWICLARIWLVDGEPKVPYSIHWLSTIVPCQELFGSVTPFKDTPV